MDDSYPELLARTFNFSLGQARPVAVSPDGARVVFLRSRGPEDSVRCLWVADAAAGTERLIADPGALADMDAPMSEEERARRERTRDRSSGVAEYSTDQDVRAVACTISGALFLARLDTGQVTALPAATPVSTPTLSPDGSRVAYVHDGTLRVIGADGKDDRALAEPDGPEVTYGLPEHEAGESMERHRGFWWAPDGERLAVARVDDSPVAVWHLLDPDHPEAEPVTMRYPFAGTANAAVSLHVLGLDCSRTDVDFGWPAYEYLVDVRWDASALLAVLQNRPQTVMRTVIVNPGTGAATPIREVTEETWTAIIPGFPGRTASGVLLGTADDGDTRRLTADGVPVTPPGLQVSELLGVDGDTALLAASDDPFELHLWTWSAADGPVARTSGRGRHDGLLGGGTLVVSAMGEAGDTVTVHPAGGGEFALSTDAARPDRFPVVTLLRAGARELPTAVLFPHDHVPGTRLPVLMDPYGGPAGQEAVAAWRYHTVGQWFADQGFAVIVADGRGVPGRGPRWERLIYGDRTDMIVEDQVDALHAVAGRYPDLDLGRVGIRGWSAGGTLAALAVLRRPDVFHAASAGAPVTDQLLYSTHWQERYLGDPREDPETYARNSMIADAPNLRRPLLLIHGFLDDNVFPVHTLRLSTALLAAGKQHTVLPLHDSSHMPSGPAVRASILRYELDFLRNALNA